jgi:MFS superfamily sulfate permease-like transporter
MAYAAIVNVPPVASLWAALAAIVAYAVLGSSRILSSGPESTIALMTGVAIAPLAAQNPDRAVALSATLALIVAGWSLLLGCCGPVLSPNSCPPRCSSVFWPAAPY